MRCLESTLTSLVNVKAITAWVSGGHSGLLITTPVDTTAPAAPCVSGGLILLLCSAVNIN